MLVNRNVTVVHILYMSSIYACTKYVYADFVLALFCSTIVFGSIIIFVHSDRLGGKETLPQTMSCAAN